MDIVYNKDYVNEACFIYCTENLSNHYDSFLDFLMEETDQRSNLPHYFYSLFKDEYLVEKGFENLGLFLYIMNIDDCMNSLLEGYMKDIKQLLKNYIQKKLREKLIDYSMLTKNFKR